MSCDALGDQGPRDRKCDLCAYPIAHKNKAVGERHCLQVDSAAMDRAHLPAVVKLLINETFINWTSGVCRFKASYEKYIYKLPFCKMSRREAV